MKKVIFVCTGNTCRSPMAMFVFNKKAEERNLNWRADSAGLASFGDPINANSVKSLAKIGIKNIDYTSKRLNFYMIDEADLIITMTDEHKNALITAGVPNNKILVLGNGIPDPYGGSEEVYFDCLNNISSAIEDLIKGGTFYD